MPVSAEQKSRRPGRINPALTSVESLASALGTDIEKGLAPKEAAKRLARSEGLLFSSGTMSLRTCIGRMCREPVLWLFLAFSIVAVFFGRTAIGLVCTGLTLLYAAFSVYMLYRSEQIDAAMSVYDRPLCHVVRGGRVRRVRGDAVVRGDVLILFPGDLVPADCRLISADADFTVTERELESRENLRHAVRLVKNASAHPVPSARHTHSPENMVFAGGIVESGTARALVTAVGQHTHLAGLTGSIRPSRGKRVPESASAAKKRLDSVNILLVLLVIPLTAVGILTLRSRYDLLDIVLAAASLCVLTLRTPMLIREGWIGAMIRHKTAVSRDADSTADIRTSVVLDSLDSLDEIMLVGTAGLHDGACHPDSLCVGTDSYDCTRFCDAGLPSRFIEGLFMIRTALSEYGQPIDVTEQLHGQEGMALIAELISRSQFEPEALRLRADTVTAYVSGSANRVLTSVTAEMKSGRTVSYRLTDRFLDVTGCTTAAAGEDEYPISEAVLGYIRTQARKAQLAGYRSLYLVSVCGANTCLEGLLIYTPHTCRKTAGIIRSLEEDGIRVTAFLHGSSEEDARCLSECGLTSSCPADLPTGTSSRIPAVVKTMDGVCAFEGCDNAYILSYLRTRQKQGAKVGVLASDAGDLALLSAADVSFTVSPSLYGAGSGAASEFIVGEYADADGLPDGNCATDLCRRRSDVIVRRTTDDGGGIHGVRKAISAARHYRHLLHSVRRFAVCSQIIRAAAFIIPLCFGLSLTSAILMLCSGFVVDTALTVMTVLARFPSERDLRTEGEPLSRKTPQASDWTGFRRAFFKDIIVSAAAALVPWCIAIFASLTGMQFGNSLGYYAALCMFAGQTAVCLTDPCLRGRMKYGFPGGLFMVCVYVGCLAAALGGGLAPWWSLVFPLTSAAVIALINVVSAGGRNSGMKK
ncbi:MAG: hypothetical protein MJ192_00760 [Clostridia bacterium]|nr:hypothetical protein [Clostridia bacterium]